MAEQQDVHDGQACGLDSRGVTVLERQRYAGRGGLQAMREGTSEILYDLAPASPDDEFETTYSAAHLGSAILFEMHMTPIRFDRTPLHVARGGLDHYQVGMFLEGGCQADCHGRVVEMGPGSIGVCDMAERERSDIFAACAQRSSRCFILVLPRTLLSPLLWAPDSVGYMVIAGHTPYGRLLGEHLVSVWRSVHRLSSRETEAVVRATTALIAGGVGVSTEGKVPLSNAYHTAKRAAIKRYIRENAGSPDLSVERLAGRFGLSRASLFRLFEAEGGPVHYMQKCRLDRALATLTSPAHRDRSIFNVALDCCFASEGSFIRAFRRTFGLTPGEMRKMVHSSNFRGYVKDEGVGASRRPTGLLWLEGLSSPRGPMGNDVLSV